MSSNKTELNTDHLSTTISELFFTLLPFIVLGIVFIYQGSFHNIIFISEWSFASAILNGQALVKFVSKSLELSSKSGSIPNPDRMGMVIAGFTVFLLVPSLVILAVVIMDKSQSFWLAITQVIIFLLSVIMYFLVGYIFSQGESYLHKEANKQNGSEEQK